MITIASTVGPLSIVGPAIIRRNLKLFTTYTMLAAKVISKEPLDNKDAKWIHLKKIHYTDQDGKHRLWESAERTTRKDSGIDDQCFPLSTVIIEQYRPPLDNIVIELPAGLVDAGETAEAAAIRELKEETGYEADVTTEPESSPIVVSDPGMTNANMKLVVVSVLLEDKLETPTPHLDDGEHIITRVVELDQLVSELKVDAKLSHFAAGYAMAKRISSGAFP
ncbi:NUDIX hydrolase domain-like protein [Suillus subaureus]|uniref:NUDIX hydrolase domain-like protein n=1 Tax=Suillus subaureus TaxID=48587 RepID=A0A9P7J5T5_9AGAM|nr:NUDIX hydrolase domain-like protein [Suillus subaureus]KAG1804241.1 NUDIX hydrolase domain-like protein [Suillus subaureus]